MGTSLLLGLVKGSHKWIRYEGGQMTVIKLGPKGTSHCGWCKPIQPHLFLWGVREMKAGK